MESEKQILFAGFGGQGVLSMGKFLTYAAMGAGKNVSWLPSYGAEMRGGTANCLVTIAEEEISSPLTDNPSMAIIMNRPSMDRFEEKVKPQGTLIINSSMVDRPPRRDDLSIYKLPVNQIADDMGNSGAANMILLGACLQKTNVVSVEQALELFEVIFKGKKESVIQRNREAFLLGVQYAKDNW
ncbi:MAG: 2-oxoacid:acceptor oxidoreductase family protein [Firmicutes bacterium]|nr:2-oxoacid:acceptor oxidoreductase family protein [Bacillota bacterium]